MNRNTAAKQVCEARLLHDAARILRELLNDDAASWDDARDWLKTYAQITKGKG